MKKKKEKIKRREKLKSFSVVVVTSVPQRWSHFLIVLLSFLVMFCGGSSGFHAKEPRISIERQING